MTATIQLPIQSASVIRPLPGDPGPMMMLKDAEGTLYTVGCVFAGVEYPLEGDKFQPRRVYRVNLQSTESGLQQTILGFVDLGVLSKDTWIADPEPWTPPAPKLEAVPDQQEASPDA